MAHENIISIFKEFGREGGVGADSIVKAALFATGAAQASIKAVVEADAEELYMAYREGYDSEAHYADKFEAAKKMKVQISLFRTFLKPEVVKNGTIHERALVIRAKIDPKMRKHSTYNGLVALNRAQIEKGMKDALTDDEIRTVLSKPEATEKSELEKLEALLPKLVKINDAVGGLIDAIANVEARIQRLKADALTGEDSGDGTEEETETETPKVDPLAALLANVTAATAGALAN